MKGVITMFRQMTKEDREIAKQMDHEGMMNEIDDQMQKWISLINFNHATDKQIALIDATMVTMYEAMQEGGILIEKASIKNAR